MLKSELATVENGYRFLDVKTYLREFKEFAELHRDRIDIGQRMPPSGIVKLKETKGYEDRSWIIGCDIVV